MKTVLIIGMGTVGKYLAYRMQELGNEVMIVDKNEERIQELSVVTIGESSYASLDITALLKELGAKYVITKAKHARQAEFLKKIGADEVFFPEREIAEKLAVRYNAKNIFDYIELTSEYSIFELPILKEWEGKGIHELNIRRIYHVNIIAVKREEVLIPLSGEDLIFQENDHIVIIGKSSDAFRLSART